MHRAADRGIKHHLAQSVQHGYFQLHTEATGVKPHTFSSCRPEAGNLPAVAGIADAQDTSYFFPLLP